MYFWRERISVLPDSQVCLWRVRLLLLGHCCTQRLGICPFYTGSICAVELQGESPFSAAVVVGRWCLVLSRAGLGGCLDGRSPRKI